MTNLHGKSFFTRAVHAGERIKPGPQVSVTTPIVSSVGYVYDNMNELDAVFANTQPGYIYSRYTSPTIAAFEQAVANLEDGEAALAFASGMAAIQAALLSTGLKSGSAILSAFDVYGATHSLLAHFFTNLGVNSIMVDVSDLDAVEKSMERSNAVGLIVETISNPLLKIPDIPRLVEIAHRHGALLLVDNTFATPWLLRPLSMGADLVVHSATKYLSGHGDVLAGVVITSAGSRARMFETNKLLGATLGPFEAWLALRGLKTLPLRASRQFASAQVIANWLASHPKVAKVNYPGLPSHPQYELAKSLFEGKAPGGIISFEIKDAGKNKAFRFMEALELCLPVTSLGDIYTLVLHPATSSHRTLTDAERKQVGISDGLLRISIGIEDPADIQNDLEQAFKKIQ